MVILAKATKDIFGNMPSVTTRADECKLVGYKLMILETHDYRNVEDIVYSI